MRDDTKKAIEELEALREQVDANDESCAASAVLNILNKIDARIAALRAEEPTITSFCGHRSGFQVCGNAKPCDEHDREQPPTDDETKSWIERIAKARYLNDIVAFDAAVAQAVALMRRARAVPVALVERARALVQWEDEDCDGAHLMPPPPEDHMALIRDLAKEATDGSL